MRQYRISRQISDIDDDDRTVAAASRVEDYFSDCTAVARRRLGVRPSFGYYDDDEDPNAFATPAAMFGVATQSDGAVLFGKRLLARQLRLGGAARNALIVIVAHEYSHILQFKRARGGRCPDTELEADYLAGWALGRESLANRGGQVDVEAMAQTMFSFGDYNFNSPDFHGTQAQRRDAVTAGYNDGRNQLPLETAYARAISTSWLA